MGYSQNLCKLMEQTNTSSYKLAKEIGVHTSTITNWKDGTIPRVDHLQLVSNYFGVTVDELLANTNRK